MTRLAKIIMVGMLFLIFACNIEIGKAAFKRLNHGCTPGDSNNCPACCGEHKE